MTRPVFEEGYAKEFARGQWRVSQLERRPDQAAGTAIYAIENNEVDIPVVVGDNQFQWLIPEDLDEAVLLKVEAYVTHPSSSGNIQVQLALLPGGAGAASDMLTTKIEIDAGEVNSKDSTPQPVVDPTNDAVAWGDHIQIDVDVAGTGALGLGLVAYFTPAATKAVAVQGAKGNPGGVTNWTGSWQAGPTTYTESDAVSHNGASYVAVQDVPADVIPGVTPGWEDYWMVLNEGSEFAMLTYYVNNQGREMDIGLKAYNQFAFPCELVSYVLLADRMGSILLDIWKDDYASYPPTIADSIVGAAPPVLTVEDKSNDATLTGWDTSIAEGDILYVVVSNPPPVAITSFSLNFKVRRL